LILNKTRIIKEIIDISFYTLSPLKMGKKGYNAFGRMDVTGRRRRGRPPKVGLPRLRLPVTHIFGKTNLIDPCTFFKYGV